MVLVEVRGNSYYMNKKLHLLWSNLKDGKLTKRDDDRCYIVDGRERSGKSLFTFQQAAFIDPTILDDGPNGEPLPRITFSGEDTLKAIRTTKSDLEHTKVIIFDEAFRGMSSRGTLSKENKMLSQAVQEMGQNNVILFIVAPRFFMLELYIAVLRSHALFHIAKERRTNRRYFRVYNEKKKGLLYQTGMRKGWAYNVKTGFRDKFYGHYPGGDEFEKRYRAKKLVALQTMGVGVNPEKIEDSKRTKQRDKLIYYLYKEFGKTFANTSRLLEKAGVPLDDSMVRLICGKYSEKMEELTKTN